MDDGGTSCYIYLAMPRKLPLLLLLLDPRIGSKVVGKHCILKQRGVYREFSTFCLSTTRIYRGALEKSSYSTNLH